MARLRSAEVTIPIAASSFWPTISRCFPPWRRNRAEVGSLIAMASPSQACAMRGSLGQVGDLRNCSSNVFRDNSAGASPSKTIWVRCKVGFRSWASWEICLR